MTNLVVNLPFEGFYNSLYSDALDHEEERWVEWELEREEGEQRFPPELRLSADELAETLARVTDYRAAQHSLARAYVDAFNIEASDALDLPLGLAFESMDSPHEYNFATDRVYAFISPETIGTLFRRSAEEDHATLAAVIRERFTSRSGFISHYDNTLPDWLEKPVTEWDHNELGTLLLAALRKAGADEDEMRWSIYYTVTEDSGAYQAWGSAVDWPRFDTECEELRAEKQAELVAENADDPNWIPPAERCPYTLDLFRP